MSLSANRRSPWRGDVAALALFFGIALLVHGVLEFQSSGMNGVDGYFHLKLARLYSTGEFPIFGSDFPWMTCSSLNDLRCDWQLGYHLVLVPFTWAGLLLGGKLSVIFFAALIPTTVYGILRAERVPCAAGFAALLLVASEYYLLRVHLPRPTSLVILLLLLATYFAGRRRNAAAAGCILSMLLVYAVPHNAIALVVVATAASLLASRSAPIGLLGGAAGALAAGVVLHPGFWQWRGSFVGGDHALFNVWRQMSGSLAAAGNDDRIQIDGEWVTMMAPAEFQPPDASELLGGFLLPSLMFGVAVVFGVIALKRRNRVVLTACGMAAAYFVLFLQHARFAEYWVPFSVLAGALALGDVLGARAISRRGKASLAVALVALAAVPGARAITGIVARFEDGTGIGLSYEEPMAWLSEHTAERDIVFHARWPQFSPMFFFNHRNRYLVGLDSYFFYQHDPDKYRRWMQISLGELEPNAARDAILAFDSRHVFVKRDDPLDVALRRAKRTLVMYENEYFRIYEIEAD